MCHLWDLAGWESPETSTIVFETGSLYVAPEIPNKCGGFDSLCHYSGDGHGRDCC